MRSTSVSPSLAIVAAVTVLLGGCAESAEPGTDTTLSPTATPSSDAAATATPSADTSPPASAARDPLDRFVEEGYSLSDEWVVETVVRDIDAGTGGIAVDDDGVIYTADFGYAGHAGDTVRRIQPDGTIERLATSDDFGSLTMTVLRPDQQGLVQSSYQTDTVFAIGLDGSVETIATGIDGPTGLVATEDGTVFVASFDSGTIHRVAADGTVTDVVTDERLRDTNSLARGPDGTLYTASFDDGWLHAVDPDSGTVTPILEFRDATSHLAYSDGALYVTSRFGYVVFRYDLATEEVAIIAGAGTPGDRDGRGTAAAFGRPNAIAVGPGGSLWTNHGDGRSNSPVTIRRIIRQP